MAISNKYMKATFRLTGEDEAENIEGVDIFKYLGRPLDQSDEN